MKRIQKIIKGMAEGKSFEYEYETKQGIIDKFTLSYKDKKWYLKVNNIGSKFPLTKKWVIAIVRLNTQGKLKDNVGKKV